MTQEYEYFALAFEVISELLADEYGVLLDDYLDAYQRREDAMENTPEREIDWEDEVPSLGVTNLTEAIRETVALFSRPAMFWVVELPTIGSLLEKCETVIRDKTEQFVDPFDDEEESVLEAWREAGYFLRDWLEKRRHRTVSTV